MPEVTIHWPHNRLALYEQGIERVRRFCKINSLPVPKFILWSKEDWCFNACAFYRPEGDRHAGINICLEHCGRPCPEEMSRNWSWPRNTTDREPFGVVCHELGHHCDWFVGGTKGRYWSNYSTQVQKDSGEKPISGYCPDPTEWFAEIFLLFVTNPNLLKELRPKIYGILASRFKPAISSSWRTALGTNVPTRVIRSIINKGAI
jgi:hypothetical protein